MLTNDNSPQLKKIRRQVIILLCIVMGMFGFGYGLVPLYNAMCKSLGINGKTSGEASAPVTAMDTSRTITVQFLTTTNADLPFKFYPNQRSIEIHPGQNTRVSFYAKNESDHTMTVQAIPSISPGTAAKHLKKTECFCFRKQTFAAQAFMDMPVLFHLDRDLAKDVNTVTLSYTLFDVTHFKNNVPTVIVGHIK